MCLEMTVGCVEARVSQALPTLYAAGAELPAIHSLLRQPSQRQKIDVVISTSKIKSDLTCKVYLFLKQFVTNSPCDS